MRNGANTAANYTAGLAGAADPMKREQARRFWGGLIGSGFRIVSRSIAQDGG